MKQNWKQKLNITAPFLRAHENRKDLSEYAVFRTRFETTTKRARIQSVTPHPNLQNVCYPISVITT